MSDSKLMNFAALQKYDGKIKEKIAADFTAHTNTADEKYATKTEMGTKLDSTAASTTYATKTEMNNKANSSDVYTKDEIDGFLGNVAPSYNVIDENDINSLFE